MISHDTFKVTTDNSEYEIYPYLIKYLAFGSIINYIPLCDEKKNSNNKFFLVQWGKMILEKGKTYLRFHALLRHKFITALFEK